MRLGILGALIPLELFINPKIKREREIVMDRLRNVSIGELRELPGYSAPKRDVRFEEKKKGRYRIHLGENWLLLDGQSAQDLHSAIQ